MSQPEVAGPLFPLPPIILIYMYVFSKDCEFPDGRDLVAFISGTSRLGTQ